MCAKFLCDRPDMLWTRALQNFINFECGRNIFSGTRAWSILQSVTYALFNIIHHGGHVLGYEA